MKWILKQNLHAAYLSCLEMHVTVSCLIWCMNNWDTEQRLIYTLCKNPPLQRQFIKSIDICGRCYRVFLYLSRTYRESITSNRKKFKNHINLCLSFCPNDVHCHSVYFKELNAASSGTPPTYFNSCFKTKNRINNHITLSWKVKDI